MKMKKFILGALLLTSLSTFAQRGKPKPIADETSITETKTKYKVITSSDEVYLKVMRKYRDSVDQVIMKPNKQDNNGKYTEYTVYFKLELKPQIEKFLKSL
jgi:hypothetical protein